VKGLRDTLAELKLSGLFAEIHEELSDLMGVHARSRDLDRASPVEVVVAEVKSELLHGCLIHI
jgi:hypothetical protein